MRLRAAMRSGGVPGAAAAALLLALAVGGCSTSRSPLETDAEHPAVRVTSAGVFMGDSPVRPEDVAGRLEDFDVPRDRTIHILLAEDVRDLRPARFLMACLAKAGYTRPVLVTRRHAESVAVGRRRPKPGPSGASRSPQPGKVRYKKSWE